MWRCPFAPQLSQENSIGSKIPRPTNSGWSIVHLRWFRWWFSSSMTNRFHTVVFSLIAHAPWIRWHLRVWRVRSLTLPKTVTPSHPLLRVVVEASRWVPEILKWLLTPPGCKSYTHKASKKSHFYKLEEHPRRDKVTSLGDVPFSHKGEMTHLVTRVNQLVAIIPMGGHIHGMEMDKLYIWIKLLQGSIALLPQKDK